MLLFLLLFFLIILLSCSSLLFIILLFLLLFFLIILLSCSSLLSLLSLRSLGFSLLLAGSLTEPLGKLLGWSLAPVIILLLPCSLQVFSSDNFPATFIHFLSVIIRSGVCSTLILGVHSDLWWVLSSQGLWVKTLLQGLGSELSLLSLLQFLEVKLLSEFSLLIVILVSLHLDDGLEKLLSLGLELIRVHGLKSKRLDSDAKGNLLLLFKLFLGLGQLLAGITSWATSISLLGLLSLKHFLSLGFSLLQTLFLLFSFLGFSLSLLSLHFLFLFALLLIELLLLLKSDLLPLGLLLLELRQLILLLLSGLSPF